MKKIKTKEEILNQSYISANDLKILIPTLGINTCRILIKRYQEIMKEKKLYIPESREQVALTSIIKKKLGL